VHNLHLWLYQEKLKIRRINNMTTTSNDQFNIQGSLGAFTAFETVKQTDETNLSDKIKAWKEMHASPEVMLMLFCVMIMDSGGPFDNTYSSKTGLKADGSSITRNKEDLINETGKEMNYVTAYRNCISDVKAQEDDGKDGGGSTTQINADIALMQQYFSQQIFQGSSQDTFTQAQTDITSVMNDCSSGGTFSSLADMWAWSQKGPNDPSYDATKVTTAGNDIQKLTNAINNLFSMTSVNSNALGAQLQDAEGDYKSFLAVITKMMQALFQVISQTMKASGG
jgi:hypothetical protein